MGNLQKVFDNGRSKYHFCFYSLFVIIRINIKVVKMGIWFEITVISLLFSISITTYSILKKIDKNKMK